MDYNFLFFGLNADATCRIFVTSNLIKQVLFGKGQTPLSLN